MHRRGLTVAELLLGLWILAAFGVAIYVAFLQAPPARSAEPGDPRVPSFVGTYTSPPPAGPWTGAAAGIPSGTGISVMLPHTTDNGTVGQFLDFPQLWANRLNQAADEVSLNITFAFDSAEIEEWWQDRLDLVAATLLDNPELRLSLEGHADLVGTELYNLDLGYARAEAVRQALIRRDVAPERLRAVSFGSSAPLQMALGKLRANRRVEIVPYFFIPEK